MKTSALAALAAALLVAAAAPSWAGGAGSCGKGKKWSAEAGKCIPKPSGTGSGSHQG